MEPRQCTASVLESLMGFGEQISQHQAPMHSRVLSEGYLQRVASIGIPKMKFPFRAEDSFSRCNELWEKADFDLSAAYMPLTRHNFRNQKQFSTDKVMQISKVFEDLPDVVDSMDISPGPTREKKYIFNHVENRPSVSKSHYTLTEGNNDSGTKFKDMKQRQACSFENLDVWKSSRPFLEWRDKLSFSSSSPTSLKGSLLVNDKCKDFHSSPNGKHISKEIKERTMEYELPPIKQPSQVSSILDGSKRKTRHGFVDFHLKTTRSESIYDDGLRKVTECKMTSSSGLSNWKAEYKSVESYKVREPRDKVIEEQMKTENCMLSTQVRKMNEISVLPHCSTLPSDLNCKPVSYDFQKHVCSDREHLHSGSPLCLRCNDKRPDHLSKNSHRLRFDSSSTVTARSRTRSRYESLRNTWFLKPEGFGTCLQCKPLNRNSNKMDASERSLKLSSKKMRVFPCPDSENNHIDNDGCMIVDDLETRVEKNGLCDQHSLNSPSSRSKVVFCKQNNPAKQENQEDPASEHYRSKELDSIVNLEEVYQPSPVSVLEPRFREETLSSSSSSGINSRDLMRQLELLMSDSSGTNSEGHDIFVSSDDDGGEVSICSSDEIGYIMSTSKFKDSRDFSYLVDVLSEAGLHFRNLEHGQERHAISPSVFETLEKKFGEQNSWKRSERKLLFDRINSGLVELFQSFVGVPEWAKPVSRRFRPLLNQEMVEEELLILLDSQEREANKDLVDKQFGKEIGWIDLEDEIDSICRELEKSLINELVADFGRVELF